MKIYRIRELLLHWFPLLLWMSLIFFLSHQDKDESKRTSEIVLWLLNIVQIDIESLRESNFIFVMRKVAHLSVYFVLSLFSHRVFNLYLSGTKLWVYIWSFCVIYASTDEFHQTFVLGRVGTIVDVGIDAIGAFLGICLLIFLKNRQNQSLAGT